MFQKEKKWNLTNFIQKRKKRKKNGKMKTKAKSGGGGDLGTFPLAFDM